jgi:DNA adenine methylase
MTCLPRAVRHVGVPPVKCQGIKTKLVPFILSSVRWDSGPNGRWVEPFLGSGVVAFNLAPERALLTDSNEHIVRLYRGIYDGEITAGLVRSYLEVEAERLRAGGADYYYSKREHFNQSSTSLDFLFLNRSCFNGVMRFNRKGQFNVPFGHKPDRYSKAYITKIVNQVAWVERQMRGAQWEIQVAGWDDTLARAAPADFVYVDPPYIGRHTDYFNSWTQSEAERLAAVTLELPCGYAVSMWLENRHRRNTHIDTAWAGTEIRVCGHFYHVGSTEALGNEMDEALLVRPGFATPDAGRQVTRIPQELQPALFAVAT